MKPYYDADGITIYCGDCREVLPGLGGADALVTDPPYGIYLKGGKWGKKFALKWDRQPIRSIRSIISYGKEAIVWGGNYYVLPPSRGWLVWWKRDRVATTADVELAWTSLDMNARLIDHTIAATNGERISHPTQKPLRVMLWTLGFVPNAQTILDPFMGSGTTLVAAKLLGRRAIGIELEERYCEIAVRRLAQGVLPLRVAQSKLVEAELPF